MLFLILKKIFILTTFLLLLFSLFSNFFNWVIENENLKNCIIYLKKYDICFVNALI